MTFISSSERYHRAGHLTMPPLMRFPAFAPLSILSPASTPTAARRLQLWRLVAKPSVVFRSCGFSPLQRFSPPASSEDIAPQNRKGFVTFPAQRSRSSRPRRSAFALWIETIRSFPATQVPLEGYPSPTAVPRLRSRCPLGVTSRSHVPIAKSHISISTPSIFLTDQADLSDPRLGKRSHLSRFHGRLSVVSLGRSPSRHCSVGESGSFAWRCRLVNVPFLPWVLVLFQVRRCVSASAARCAPFGALGLLRSLVSK